AHVHGRRRERRHLAAAARQVELVDRRGTNARVLPDLPDHPSGTVLLVPRAENGLAHEVVHRGALPHLGIVELFEHVSLPAGAIYDPCTSMTSPSYAGATPAGSRAARSACVASWVRCVRNVRRAPMRSAAAVASGIDRCSGWGWGSSAFRTSTSSPVSCAATASGIAFTSVRYATCPTR